MNNTNLSAFEPESAQRKFPTLKFHTKLGISLLVPPFVLWIAVITFIFDQVLGEFVFSLFTPNSLEVTFYVAGMIFPTAAIAAAVRGLQRRDDIGINIVVILIAVLFLTLVAIQMFM